MINKNSFKLSIIIPCYNEIFTIDKIINKILDSLKAYKYSNYEIVIVDDNSVDGTKEKLKIYINPLILNLKIFLVSILIVVALISIPIVSLPGDYFLGFNLKFFKHGLEWNYFLGVITFYLLTFLMWRKTN